MDPPNETASQSAIEQYSVLEFCSEVYAHFHLESFGVFFWGRLCDHEKSLSMIGKKGKKEI